MSFLYRPTPVFNPGPPPRVPLRGLPAGTMHGYAGGVNWKGFFDAKRAALQGSPWIVRSGTMGSFLGDGTDTTDYVDLPLTPIDTSVDLSPILAPLPVDLYPMGVPIDPAIAPFNPGPISSAPSIVSSGRSITSPPATSPAATPWAQIVNSLTSFGTAIARSATGQPQINPTVAPPPPVVTGTPASLTAQAQALQAQAAALANSNPSLAAVYTQEANQMLAQAGVTGPSSFMGWLTGSSIVPGIPNLAVVGGGLLGIVLLMNTGRGGRR